MAELWTAIWAWVTWGNANLRDVLAYATFFGVMYTVWSFWRSRRMITIYAINVESGEGERREIAKVPASFVTRAEVMGLVGQAAAGERLDLSKFNFDYKPTTVIEVPLPAESFRKLGPHKASLGNDKA